MKTVKRIAAVLLAVMLMAPAAVNAAAPSVRDTTLEKRKTETSCVKVELSRYWHTRTSLYLTSA